MSEAGVSGARISGAHVTIDVEERRKGKVKNTRIHDKPTHSVGGAAVPAVLQLPAIGSLHLHCGKGAEFRVK